MLLPISSYLAIILSLLLTYSRSLCSSNAVKERLGCLVEWIEKASFARLNKLFKINVVEWAYNVLLSNKNLQALIENLKPFIIPMFSRLAHSSLVLDEHFMLNDPPFFEIARLVDSEAHQARLEEYEKKC